MTDLIHLKNRGVLGINGPDAAAFLQGAITQDIEKLSKTPLLYAAHLSPQGRFLYDFFITKQDDFILLDCAKNELMDLAKSLHQYAVGQNIEMHDLSDAFYVYAAFQAFDGGIADPRHSGMGYRLVSKEKRAVADDFSAYEEKRVKLGIPDGSLDGLKGKTLTAELGLEYLNGVSFDKGCYVGQEMTARMHHRTKPKKTVFKIALADEQKPHSTLMVGEQEAGWIFSNAGRSAIAIVKERYADKFSNISKPSWWRS